ncbi:MAG: hypothetical protein SAJ72_21845 [Jaaginema sp. PMC 1080.18]|nr:hypothetical protein [Jaaginema sp. PMC 1080.18]MEC4868782.1 hypothetical protein [Jaaginema sp. PMC 1078.18]
MSLDAQILNAFLELWETQAELFSERDRAELEQIITNTEDGSQKLADAIADWYMKPEHQEIANQIESLAFDPQTSSSEISPTSSVSNRGGFGSKKTIKSSDTWKKLLEQAIKKNTPDPDPQNPPSDDQRN